VHLDDINSAFEPVQRYAVLPGIAAAARGPLPANVHVVYDRRGARQMVGDDPAEAELPAAEPTREARKPRRGPEASEGEPAAYPQILHTYERQLAALLNRDREDVSAVDLQKARLSVAHQVKVAIEELPALVTDELLSLEIRVMCLSQWCGGDERHLGPLLLQVYAAGGLGCGWRGAFPDGSLVVYWPHDSPVTFVAFDPAAEPVAAGAPEPPAEVSEFESAVSNLLQELAAADETEATVIAMGSQDVLDPLEKELRRYLRQASPDAVPATELYYGDIDVLEQLLKLGPQYLPMLADYLWVVDASEEVGISEKVDYVVERYDYTAEALEIIALRLAVAVGQHAADDLRHLCRKRNFAELLEDDDNFEAFVNAAVRLKLRDELRRHRGLSLEELIDQRSDAIFVWLRDVLLTPLAGREAAAETAADQFEPILSLLARMYEQVSA